MEKHLKNLLVPHSESAAIALWMTVKSIGGTTFVLDDDGKFSGVLTAADFSVWHESCQNLKAGDICNRNCLRLSAGPDVFLRAEAVFEAVPSARALPVIDSFGHIVDVVFKFQAFYKKYFSEPARFHNFKRHVSSVEVFPYMHYAFCLWQAATEARRNGLNSFSAIEFGVASGNGLVALQWHAHAISQIFGLDIEVYGFDTGTGLPESSDPSDMPHYFGTASYRMKAKEALTDRLWKARLVLGDIADTSKSFFDNSPPATIGAMMVDVDMYSSTVPILNMLIGDASRFLPRVQMYFDDIHHATADLGEALAIQRFNASQEAVKIVPEATYSNVVDTVDYAYNSFLHRVKTAHLFEHPHYGLDSERAVNAETTSRRFQLRF